MCVGAEGAGKKHAIYGSGHAQLHGVESARGEWGCALLACEQLLRVAVEIKSGPPTAGALGDATLAISMVEIHGETGSDLLGGGAPLPSDAWLHHGSGGDAERGPKRPLLDNAAALRVDSVEEAARALSVGLRARMGNNGPLAPSTHLLCTLSLRRSASGNGSSGAPAHVSRLLLVSLAGGELIRPFRAAETAIAATPSLVARGGDRAARRALDALGACVVRQADGGHPHVDWEGALLSSSLREVFTGDYCTTVLGHCGVGESELPATLGTLQFLRHARRLHTWVRPPQPSIEPLHRKLLALQEQIAALQTPLLLRPPTDLMPLVPCRRIHHWFHELATHVASVLSWRVEQGRHVQAAVMALQQAATETAAPALLFDRGGGGGLLNSPEMIARTAALDKQVARLSSLLDSAEKTHQSFKSALESADSTTAAAAVQSMKLKPAELPPAAFTSAKRRLPRAPQLQPVWTPPAVVQTGG